MFSLLSEPYILSFIVLKPKNVFNTINFSFRAVSVFWLLKTLVKHWGKAITNYFNFINNIKHVENMKIILILFWIRMWKKMPKVEGIASIGIDRYVKEKENELFCLFASYMRKASQIYLIEKWIINTLYFCTWFKKWWLSDFIYLVCAVAITSNI